MKGFLFLDLGDRSKLLIFFFFFIIICYVIKK